MENKITTRVVTVRDLWNIFVHKLWIIALSAAICVGAMFAVVTLTYSPRYSSTATMYILRQANESDSANDISSDFSLALKVVNDCDFLLKSETVVNAVKEDLGLGDKYADLEDYITTKNPTDTRILQITVEADTPEMAKKIVDSLCEIGAESINDAMGFDQVNLFEHGHVEPEPCNKTSVLTYLFAGGLAAAAVYLLFVIMYIMDDTLKSEEDCQTYLGVSIIGEIPDADDAHKSKYGYYKRYGYGKYKSRYSPYKTLQPVEKTNGKEDEK
ncbi:MAG: hypothetical protein IJY65_02680 [Clostridia bacterium]|nr:hypothetical protein [Clostridia bacterium]